jgi:hypothetical protein
MRTGQEEHMRRIKRVTATAAVAMAALSAVAATAAQAASFEGTIVAKDKRARTFSIKQDEGAGTVKIKVNKATEFERIAGFRALKRGMKNVEATARRNAKGRWVASQVSRRGGGGGGGADDNGGGGADDGPNHT